MATVTLHEAETQLAALMERAANGEEVIIAKDGSPPMKLQPVQAKPQTSRLGFMKGQFTVPDDFDTMLQGEIEQMFYGEADKLNP